MIRRHEPDTIWVIHQGAHAHLAGQIAAHWIGNNIKLSPREELILAATIHDTGWAAAEETPRLNAYGLPRSLMETETITNVPLGFGRCDSIRVEPGGARAIRLEPFLLDARRLYGAPFDSEEVLRHGLNEAHL